MALTGHLSDLSLSELIEFLCNQRKTGQLKVLYPDGYGYFYLQAGSVVDARIGGAWDRCCVLRLDLTER